MSTEQILKVLKNERKCIARQNGKCDRNCAKCDLCLPDTEILEVYDFLIKGYELLQNEGAESYTIKFRPQTEEPLTEFDATPLSGDFKTVALNRPFERVKENLNRAFGIKQPGKVMADFWQEGEAKLRCTNCGGELDEHDYCKECGYKLYDVTTGNDIMRQYKSMPPIGEAFEEGDTD